ncbi:hypothetical protein BDF19DRAFT_410858 [Syncephalis fuscata]|nr:hypothetical protein BDF19DRAFT_410858 [Syncephalis fuscata]
MIPIVRSPTHHGHPLYHQNQRMTVRPTPITPTTPVNATLQSNHHQTTESHIERVSYVNATASNHVPNHSGNIVFSVGLNNSGSHGKPVNGSTASSSAGVPPANTMASQISKFRATRRIVDKRDHQRRVSHSAIERRRRERINSEIGHLRRLVPSCRGQDHLHKLSVLQGAIAYIHELRRQLGIKDEASDLDPTLNAQLHDSNAEDDMEASDADNEVVFDSCSPVDSTPPAMPYVVHPRLQKRTMKQRLLSKRRTKKATSTLKCASY